MQKPEKQERTRIDQRYRIDRLGPTNTDVFEANLEKIWLALPGTRVQLVEKTGLSAATVSGGIARLKFRNRATTGVNPDGSVRAEYVVQHNK